MNNNQQSSYDEALDVTGLNCPLPVLRTKKSLNLMSSGQILSIVATDRNAMKDLEVLCLQSGNELLEAYEQANKFYFLIKKK